MKFTLGIKSILLFLFLLLFAGCEINTNIDSNDNIRGSGRIITEERRVSECSGILIRTSATVYVSQDNEQSIRIEADDNILDKVITRREGKNLIVGLEEGSYSNITLRIYVSLKTIEELSIEGAGNIVSQGPLNSDELECIINGAGNINLQGTSKDFYCKINGAGNIDADRFITENCTAIVNGAGNSTVYVTDFLNASVSGVGNIFYYGNPKTVKTSVTGLGKIQKK